MLSFIRSLYFNPRFYFAIVLTVVTLILGFFFQTAFAAGKILLTGCCTILFVDLLMLYNTSKNVITAQRLTPDRLSNGDENDIMLTVYNHYSFPVDLQVIDEIPEQFQYRNFLIKKKLNKKGEIKFKYKVRPVTRGEYHFGRINIYVNTNSINFVSRRFKIDANQNIPTYPSFIQMRKYEIMAISNRLTEVGIKKIRKISTHNEFDQIREYVKGDDYRTINWKATARRAIYMVNQYRDERSQQVFSLIDMGRVMKMPFNAMTLLDYAINASLVISKIAVYKQDKPGIITFSNRIHNMLPASRHNYQMMRIMELLYNQKTNFLESNFELLYTTIRRNIKQRSLLLLYTNFEALPSLYRQLAYLKLLSKSHLLVIIFFENTEIKSLLKKKPDDIEQLYIKTISEKFSYEKKQIVKELKQAGIYSILTEPENLTVQTINKYLELKARGLI